MMIPHTCCACGFQCIQYIKLFKVDTRWMLATEGDNPENACIIGMCCIDQDLHTFTFGSTKKKRIRREELNIQTLSDELEAVKTRLCQLNNK